MQTRAFAIEESSNSHKIVKDDINKAVYSGKFEEYIIARSHLLVDTLVVTDMINERDGVDVINSSIKELIFSDCVKKFDQVLNEVSLKNHLNTDENFKFEIIEEPFDECKSDSCVYKFEENIKILDDIVRSVKIFINGYDESSESVYLDLQILDNKSVYKYKITNDTIEISISTHMQARVVSEFLKTFAYTKMSLAPKKAKEIYIIVNDKLLYKFDIKI